MSMHIHNYDNFWLSLWQLVIDLAVSQFVYVGITFVDSPSLHNSPVRFVFLPFRLVRERDFYFDKLRRIEIICQNNGTVELTKDILEILYATEDGFTTPGNEEPEEF
ncbi:unnamed protein product [Trichobilharzia regenti]|nr:unnamed protein product [Trichobilharzia regenti]